MIKQTTLISSLALMTVSIVPAASALTSQEIRACNAMRASIEVRQQEAGESVETRTKMTEEVELAGDAWEEAEALRLFSETHAADADAKKMAYETLKGDLMSFEMALQSQVAVLNADAADYKESCAKR